jgi:hypothetical protein
MQGSLGTAQCIAERLIGHRVAVIAINVLKERTKFRNRLWLRTAVLADTIARPLAKLIQAPPGLCHPDDWDVEVTSPDQCLKGRKDLLVGEIASGSEKDQSI